MTSKPIIYIRLIKRRKNDISRSFYWDYGVMTGSLMTHFLTEEYSMTKEVKRPGLDFFFEGVGGKEKFTIVNVPLLLKE